ncbi:MAG: hypothetical protein KAJ07_10540 [Planctomycetes bacterium]|nr:hypothetical protein [Planctomycetota bacterium]
MTSIKKIRVLTIISICLLVVSGSLNAANFIGDKSDGNRSNIVHTINLKTEEGDKVFLDDDPLLPFSTKQTCGMCHNYDDISSGWHFSATDKTAAPGRPGQPWILTDPVALTQIPLSYRAWSGLKNPEKIGFSRWNFAKAFGSHIPDPMAEDMDIDPDFDARWMESGEIEVNCLSCHDAESAHDQAAYNTQIKKENFRWAPAATTAFATVKGSAKSMPGMYDYLMPPQLDDPKLIVPEISYDEKRFDSKGKVTFDLPADIANERCYFCHSGIDVASDSPEKWAHDQDVHIAAGLSCVDCHRNGIDHNIIRGYEGEEDVSGNELAAVSSCKGCHIGTDDELSAGRLGAPMPLHAGIPVVHFEKLSCTACHSGPLPQQTTIRTKDSRTHKLGTHGSKKDRVAAPHVQYPVYAKQDDGKIAPSKLIWPSFWAHINAGVVTPILPEDVTGAIKSYIDDIEPLRKGDFPKFTKEKIALILKELASQLPGEGELVFIAGGELYKLDNSGNLEITGHESAAPYIWPIAHNVRPASQSLGTGGCKDCHSADKPFLFGDVQVDSPIDSNVQTKPMLEFLGLDETLTKVFAFTFVFRPFFKVAVILSALVIILVLLAYGLKGVAFFADFLSFGYITKKDQASDDLSLPASEKSLFIEIVSILLYLALMAVFVLLLITGFVPRLISGHAPTGYMLMIHAGLAPVFACLTAAAALLWAHRSSFTSDEVTPPFNILQIALKKCFWAMLIISLPLMLSIVIGMFPIFGTSVQHCLIDIHRVCAMIFVLLAVLHMLLLIVKRRE